MYQLYFTSRAKKDSQLISQSNLKDKVQFLLELISRDPYLYPPPFEVLRGDLAGAISRRINRQHRLVYQVIESQNAIKVLMMWTHYE